MASKRKERNQRRKEKVDQHYARLYSILVDHETEMFRDLKSKEVNDEINAYEASVPANERNLLIQAANKLSRDLAAIFKVVENEEQEASNRAEQS